MNRSQFTFTNSTHLDKAIAALECKFPDLRLTPIYNKTTTEGYQHLLFVDTVDPISKRDDILSHITENGGTFVSTVRKPLS